MYMYVSLSLSLSFSLSLSVSLSHLLFVNQGAALSDLWGGYPGVGVSGCGTVSRSSEANDCPHAHGHHEATTAWG